MIMKKTAIIAITFILTFAIALTIQSVFEHADQVNNSTLSDNINIVIDAGHGGIDAGTIGVDGTKEKEINLSIALKLYDFVRVSGISAYLTRDSDYLVYNDGDDKSRSDLYNRMDFINSIPNSTLISIHQNHYEDESEWGMQVWYAPDSNQSKILADYILNVAKNNIQKDNERVNKESDDSYYLLYQAKVPSVMVECGFMSNINENNNLKDDEYQNDLSFSILQGLCLYITKS